MFEDFRTAAAFIGGAVIFIFGFIKFFLKGKAKTQKLIEKAKAKGWYTTATMVDTQFIRRDLTASTRNVKYESMRVTYEYQVRGLSYKKKLTFQSPGEASIKYPTSVTVYYDIGKPGKGVCREEAPPGSQYSTGCLLTVALAAATFIIIYNVLGLVVG